MKRGTLLRGVFKLPLTRTPFCLQRLQVSAKRVREASPHACKACIICQVFIDAAANTILRILPNHCIWIAWWHVWGERRRLRSRSTTGFRLRTKNVSRVVISSLHAGVTVKSIAVWDVKIPGVCLVWVAVDTARVSKLRIEHCVRPALKPIGGWFPSCLDVRIDPHTERDSECLRRGNCLVRIICAFLKATLYAR